LYVNHEEHTIQYHFDNLSLTLSSSDSIQPWTLDITSDWLLVDVISLVEVNATTDNYPHLVYPVLGRMNIFIPSSLTSHPKKDEVWLKIKD